MILKDVRIGNQRLILGDCLAVMPTLGRFDAVVTDPPLGELPASAWLARKGRGSVWHINTEGAK